LVKKLQTRFLKFCLEPEIFDVKDNKKQNSFIAPICLMRKTKPFLGEDKMGQKKGRATGQN